MLLIILVILVITVVTMNLKTRKRSLDDYSINNEPNGYLLVQSKNRSSGRKSEIFLKLTTKTPLTSF